MAVTSVGHQSPQSSLPPLSGKTVNVKSWLTTGNTDVVTDEYIHPNSAIVLWWTTIPAGRAYTLTIGQGTMTVTSTDVESAGLAYSYVIL